MPLSLLHVMKTLAALGAACLIAFTTTGTDTSTSPVFQLRLVLDAASSDSEPMTLLSPGKTAEVIQVQKAVLLDQTALKSAKVEADGRGGSQILIKFTAAGRKRFAEITRANIDKRLAIIVAGRACCAPVIKSEIADGTAVITGSFTKDEAKDLAKKINDALSKK